MEAISTRLILAVDALHEADDEDRAELARHLRNRLIEAEIESVQFARLESTIPRAKGDLASLSTLAVTVAPAALTALFSILQVWLSRHDRASVTVESGSEKMTLTGTLSDDQKQMVEAFLNRHKI